VENEVVEEVLDRMDAIGQAISEGAVQGFEVLIRQQYVIAFGYFLVFLVFLGAGFVILRVLREGDKKSSGYAEEIMNKLANEEEIRHYDGYAARYKTSRPEDVAQALQNDTLFHSFRFLAYIPFAIALWPLYRAVARIANPAYFAIHEVLNVFGRGV